MLCCAPPLRVCELRHARDHAPPPPGCVRACMRVQEEEKKAGGASAEHIEKPDHESTARMKHGTYDKIDNDGLVPPGAPRRAARPDGVRVPACQGPCQ